MQGIVTPEAVHLEFDEASVGSRGVALMIDGALAGLLLAGVLRGVSEVVGALDAPAWVATSTVLVLSLVIVLGYPIVFEVAASGRTPGKAALGLRVVTVEGAPVRLRHAAIRAAFLLVDVLATLGAAAVLSALLTRRSQRLGDLVAGTIVLRERQAAGPVTAHTFTPSGEAAAYAERLPPGLLDARTYARVRAFLLRADRMDPSARERVAVELARPLLEVTPPPGELDPVSYLTAVAAAQQRRVVGRTGASPAPGAADPRAVERTEVPGGFRPPV